MLAEAGILLGTQARKLPAQAFGNGFLTPATALGLPLIRRLTETGLTFTPVADAELPALVARRQKGAAGEAKRS
jgi:hypothetical protein